MLLVLLVGVFEKFIFFKILMLGNVVRVFGIFLILILVVVMVGGIIVMVLVLIVLFVYCGRMMLVLGIVYFFVIEILLVGLFMKNGKMRMLVCLSISERFL